MYKMFDIWRRTSECKTLLKQVRCQLKYLKNRTSTMVTRAREDIALLLKFGLEADAVNRVEHFCNNENLAAVYELLDNFCEIVLLYLSYIWKSNEFADEINEAISSLIFASSRCGRLPKLIDLRRLFCKRYGQKFIETASQLLPGNHVNSLLIEKICPTINDGVKQRLIEEIAKEHQEILGAIDYPPEVRVITATETRQLLKSSSSESFRRVDDDKIAYLDDTEELKLKSSPPPKTDEDEEDIVSFDRHPNSSSSKSSGQKVRPSRKRGTRRISMMGTSSSSMDEEFSKYYGCPCRKSRVDKHMNPSINAAYVRAMTMPLVRPKDRATDSVARSKSFPLGRPPFVHPKLPDYDEVAAKFWVDKIEYQRQRLWDI